MASTHEVADLEEQLSYADPAAGRRSVSRRWLWFGGLYLASVSVFAVFVEMLRLLFGMGS